MEGIYNNDKLVQSVYLGDKCIYINKPITSFKGHLEFNSLEEAGELDYYDTRGALLSYNSETKKYTAWNGDSTAEDYWDPDADHIQYADLSQSSKFSRPYNNVMPVGWTEPYSIPDNEYGSIIAVCVGKGHWVSTKWDRTNNNQGYKICKDGGSLNPSSNDWRYEGCCQISSYFDISNGARENTRRAMMSVNAEDESLFWTLKSFGIDDNTQGHWFVPSLEYWTVVSGILKREMRQMSIIEVGYTNSWTAYSGFNALSHLLNIYSNNNDYIGRYPAFWCSDTYLSNYGSYHRMETNMYWSDDNASNKRSCLVLCHFGPSLVSGPGIYDGKHKVSFDHSQPNNISGNLERELYTPGELVNSILPTNYLAEQIIVNVTYSGGSIPSNIVKVGEWQHYNYYQISFTMPDGDTTISIRSSEPLNNEIWYTSSDGIVTPNDTSALPKIDTNTYHDGKGVIKFATDVTSIGGSAFYKCTRLTSVTIPNSVTSIGYQAFWNCTGLTSVTIGNSVKSIGNYAFAYCTGLASVTLPYSVTSIGKYAFSGCSVLTSVTIPNSVTSIGEGAFDGCSSLTSMTLPYSVTSIGEWAFSNCKSLTSIEISNRVVSIEQGAFENCSSLTSISYTGTISQWNAITKGSNWRKNVPATVVHCTDGYVNL